MANIMFETNRLIVKNIDLNNKEEIANIIKLEKDADVMQFIGQGARTDEEIWEGIHKAVKHFEKHGYTLGVVYEKETGDFVGRGGLFTHQWDEDSTETEIGYRAFKKYWAKGYQSEMLQGRLDYGFNILKKEELCAAIFLGNDVSAHVMKKYGGQFVGMITYLNKYEVEKYIFKKKLYFSCK